MPGQPSVACLMLWNTHWLDSPRGRIHPPRSRIRHYYYYNFQLIQQTFISAASTGGLFLFHKNHLDVALCKQSLIQEPTVSVSELQLCSLFLVSFSNCGQPLQPQEVAAPLSLFCKPQKDLSLILQNWVFSSPKDQRSLVQYLPPARQALSIILTHPLRPSL